MTAAAPPPDAVSAPPDRKVAGVFTEVQGISLALSPDCFPAHDDGEMAGLVRAQGTSTQLLVVANTFTVALYARATDSDAWFPLCSGDLGEATGAALSLSPRSGCGGLVPTKRPGACRWTNFTCKRRRRRSSPAG